MSSTPRMIRKVVNITTNKEQSSDYQYWATRSVAERLDAIELLRRPYLDKLNDVSQRLQRVYRVTQQS